MLFLLFRHLTGMTKIKMSNEEAGSLEFVERRRAALERSVFTFVVLLGTIFGISHFAAALRTKTICLSLHHLCFAAK